MVGGSAIVGSSTRGWCSTKSRGDEATARQRGDAAAGAATRRQRDNAATSSSSSSTAIRPSAEEIHCASRRPPRCCCRPSALRLPNPLLPAQFTPACFTLSRVSVYVLYLQTLRRSLGHSRKCASCSCSRRCSQYEAFARRWTVVDRADEAASTDALLVGRLHGPHGQSSLVGRGVLAGGRAISKSSKSSGCESGNKHTWSLQIIELPGTPGCVNDR